MKKDNKVYLQDIQKAITKIEEYIKDVSFDRFQDETMIQDAVIRQFEIIGEAASRISKEFLDDHPDFPLKEAIRMRNFLIHGYDEVDPKVVWKTFQEDIPVLKEQVKKLNSN